MVPTCEKVYAELLHMLYIAWMWTFAIGNILCLCDCEIDSLLFEHIGQNILYHPLARLTHNIADIQYPHAIIFSAIGRTFLYT